MRFTLDGESFELTPDIVRQRLVGATPKPVQQYWVEIDGVRWPVKQVIAIATGAASSRFQSQDSRRWLASLGFNIFGEGNASGRAKQPRSEAFNAQALTAVDPLDVRVAFSWLQAGDITLDSDGLPLFPSLPRLPGLYRFDFGVDATGSRRLYIGESANVARRGTNYRNAKHDRTRQLTSRRIHKEVVAHLAAGGVIHFAVAIKVAVNGEPADLRRTSARRLAENAAVLQAQIADNVTVLNIDTDLPPDEE